MNSQTTIFSIGGVEYEVKKVEAKQPKINQIVLITNHEQAVFMEMMKQRYAFTDCLSNVLFFDWIRFAGLAFQWESFLISEARKRGFVSRATIKTATDMDVMKSGRLQLIGLSKLATMGRKQIIIYDSGKWVAEVVSNKEQRISGHYWVQSGPGEAPEVLYYSQSRGWISTTCNYVDSDFFRIFETKLDEPKWK